MTRPFKSPRIAAVLAEAQKLPTPAVPDIAEALGCPRRAVSVDLARLKKLGLLSRDVCCGKRKVERRCSVEGCEREHYGIGFCRRHYYRSSRGLDPHAQLRAERTPELVEAVGAALVDNTRKEVADMFGISKPMVGSIARMLGIPSRVGWRKSTEIPVPSWVPEEMAAGYVKRVRRDGQFSAAAWARQEKVRRAAMHSVMGLVKAGMDLSR